MISPYASSHGAPCLDGYHNSVKPLNINTNHINHHARQSIRQTGAKKLSCFSTRQFQQKLYKVMLN